MATQFTTGTSPQTGAGQVWVENSNGEWEIANVTAPGVVRRVFTNADTGTSFTPSPGMIFAEVICVGPGGGGGGIAQSASRALGSGGGGAGAWVRSLLTAEDIGASQTMTIPAGGAGGAAGANDGAAASDTSFGSLVVAEGGSGGQHADSADGGLGGIGGLVANCTGDEKYPGEYGQAGLWESATTLYFTYGEPKGGSSPWGAYVSTRSAGGAGAGASATDSEGYGTGGSGTYSLAGTGTLAGGDGADGLIIVTEYIRQSVLSPIAYDSNGNEILDLVNGEVASAVNHVQVDNAATGNGPGISAIGDDTNIDLNLYTKGNGDFYMRGTPDADAQGIPLYIKNERTSITDAAHIGSLAFVGYDDAANAFNQYGVVRSIVDDVSSGSEDSHLSLRVASAGTFQTEAIRLSGSGLSFDAGTNYMDDYEEGTWTPTIEGSTTNPTVTYDVQTGNYTKVGNICTASFSVDLATYSGGSGFLWLNGLPFNSAGDQNVYGVAFTFVQNLDWGTGDTMICAHVENNDNFFYWYGQTNNSGANIVSVGDASASTTMAGTVTYRTA